MECIVYSGHCTGEQPAGWQHQQQQGIVICSLLLALPSSAEDVPSFMAS